MMDKKELIQKIESMGTKKIVLIFVLGIALIVFSFPSSGKKTSKSAKSTESQEDTSSTDAYVKKQEQRLMAALKQVWEKSR